MDLFMVVLPMRYRHARTPPPLGLNLVASLPAPQFRAIPRHCWLHELHLYF